MVSANSPSERRREYGWRDTTGARTGFDGVVKGGRSVRHETRRTLIVLALNGCQGVEWECGAVA